MKKSLIIGLTASLLIALGATFAFAESPNKGMMDKKTEMNEMHKNMIEQHVKDGTLTPEQAKVMDEHMAKMGPMMNGMMGGNASCHSKEQSTNIPQQ